MLHQNTFSRTVANEGKMGAYYTDLSHCRSLSSLFCFPEGEEVCVLEPSIGDATAVIAATRADQNPNIKIFGVELNDAVAAETRENPYIEECIRADFTDGVKISNNRFTFVFANPPYLNDSFNGNERLERVFLEKVNYYLQKNGILVWIIPFSVYTEENYFRFLNSRYEVLHTYRFRPKEYAKFHQVVIIGRKRVCSVLFNKVQLDEMRQAVIPDEKVPLLPETFAAEDQISVPPSRSEDVILFASKEFDLAVAEESVQHLPANLLKHMDETLSMPAYTVNSIGSPPIPLKKDSMYLLATSGSGQGITGSEETGDIHLQRGVAEIIEEGDITESETNPDNREVRVTSRTAITMTILQNNGKIDMLQ